jgi:hypothetical protein
MSSHITLSVSEKPITVHLDNIPENNPIQEPVMIPSIFNVSYLCTKVYINTKNTNLCLLEYQHYPDNSILAMLFKSTQSIKIIPDRDYQEYSDPILINFIINLHNQYIDSLSDIPPDTPNLVSELQFKSGE